MIVNPVRVASRRSRRSADCSQPIRGGGAPGGTPPTVGGRSGSIPPALVAPTSVGAPLRPPPPRPPLKAFPPLRGHLLSLPAPCRPAAISLLLARHHPSSTRSPTPVAWAPARCPPPPARHPLSPAIELHPPPPPRPLPISGQSPAHTPFPPPPPSPAALSLLLPIPPLSPSSPPPSPRLPLLYHDSPSTPPLVGHPRPVPVGMPAVPPRARRTPRPADRGGGAGGDAGGHGGGGATVVGRAVGGGGRR